jgi:hypothetical protein
MRLIIYILIIGSLLSCSKTELGPQCENCPKEPITATNFTDVLIVNEGNYTNGNASLSFYKSETQEVYHHVYSNANTGIPLGDVAQSALQIGNKLYVVVNNSSKIEVLNANNFETIQTINGFNSPRYILPINNQKAYVSDLYANAISILDLNTHTISGTIPTNGWTEKMLLHNDTAYVCNYNNSKILIINTATNTIVGDISTGKGVNSIALDKNNKIWVLCNGGINEETPRIIQFNPANRAIEKTISFASITQSPTNLVFNDTKDEFVFINQDVFKMSINDNSIPSTPFITRASGSLFYGLSISPVNNEIYIADAKDYVQKGDVYRYSYSGNLIHQFEAGIIPDDFLFFNQ